MTARPPLRSVDLALAVLGATLGLAGTLATGPALMGRHLGHWLLLAAVAAGGTVGLRLTAWLLVDVLLVRMRGIQASALVRMLTSWALYLGGLLALLRWGLGFDVSTLLTGSAVLGAVGGFALQSTLDNLFAGVSLQLEQPFRLGDVVRVGEVVGAVEAMTWRAVHLRAEGGSRIVVPNSVIGSGEVEVLQQGVGSERAVELEADPTAPPGQVIELLTRAVSAVPNVSAQPAAEVYPLGLKDWLGSRVYEVQYVPEDFLDFERTEAQIRRRGWYCLERHGFGASDMALRQGTAGAVPRRRGGPTADVLGRAPLLEAFGSAGLESLAELAETLLYTEGESIADLPDPGPAIFVVGSGRLVATLPELLPEELPQELRPEAAKAAAWTPQELESVQRRLVDHLGPVAPRLVRRAARRTVDPGRLLHLLADEIADPAARASFLEGATDRATHELVEGDLIGVLSVFSDRPLELDRLRAATEVTLWRLPRAVVLGAARERPGLLATLLPALRTWRATHPARALIKLPDEGTLRALLSV